MKKLKINEIVVVEGKDDVTTLNQVLDATIIHINGASGLNKNVINKLKELSRNNKLILFMDPDYTGKKIREKISNNLENVVNLYVSRNKATKKNNIGVENVKKEDLYNIFEDYISTNKNKVSNKKYIYTMDDLIKFDLTGKPNSKKLREKLGDNLKIGYYNSKRLLSILNGMNLDYEEFKVALKKGSTGIIFGKFIPVHKGHLNFIEYASKKVEKLYVILCVEKDRDKKLLSTSTLPKFISEEDRYKFIKENISKLDNVEVLILREEGINSYPNGWQDWSYRVFELLESNKIFIDTIFTNEVQDKDNYLKYFKNYKVFSEELNLVLTDPNRFEYNVSATKVRNNYKDYKNYLPNNVIKYFEK